MACFWKGLLRSLDGADYKALGLNGSGRSACALIAQLKIINKPTPNVNWQQSRLSKKQLEENMEHIQVYNKQNSRNGYFCSTCDPFLLLLSEVLHIDIIHIYLGHTIKYTHNDPKKTYYYSSNRGHFRYVKKTY